MLTTWAVYTVALWATSRVLPGFELRGGFTGALAVGAIYGLLNLLLGWLLYVVIGVATLGIGFLIGFATRFVVTTILLVVTDAVSERLEIAGWRTAALGALGMSFFGMVTEWGLRALL